MVIPPFHYNDHREHHLHTFSAGYHSLCADDLQREPWPETFYLRGRHLMGNNPHADTFEHRWEEPTSFRRYRSVTPPPNHGVSAYGPEASSPMEAYLSAPMESHCNQTYGWQATPNGPSAAFERVRSLISVYGQQTHPRRHNMNHLKWINTHILRYQYLEVNLTQPGYLHQMLLNYLQHLVFLRMDEKHLHHSECIDQLLLKIFYTAMYLQVDLMHQCIWLHVH
jgi:hypothetical protein